MEGNSSDYVEYTATVPLQVIHAVVGAAIVVVNTLVMVAYATDREIRKVPCNVFIINLSISDFITGLDVLIRFAWIRMNPVIHIFESNFCLVVGAFHYGALLASVVMVIFISWDRFQLVSDPFKYRLRTVRRNLKVAIFGWSLSLLYVVVVIFVYPPLYGAIRGRRAPKAICIESQLSGAYIVFSVAFEFLIPLCIIILLNGGVIYKLRKATYEKLRKQREELGGAADATDSIGFSELSSRVKDPEDNEIPREERLQSGGRSISTENNQVNHTVSNGDRSSRHASDVPREGLNSERKSISTRVHNGAASNGDATSRNARDTRLRESINKEWRGVRRTARLLHLFVAVFIVCWLPFYVIIIVDIFTPVDERRITGSSLNLYFNSLINPFLYAFMSRKFRRRFQLMAKCRRR